MGKMKEKLLAIDEELAQIEAIPYDECSPDQVKRHHELCKERWAMEPPVGFEFLGRRCN
ncbi:hypothetical protein [Hyphomicrobium sp. ghe19]|uniref:hypothetical protein n=1 Tax=Hyphomicrobium sp. ghe19 TaxID=2682968 RepID=UPI0030D4B6BB